MGSKGSPGDAAFGLDLNDKREVAREEGVGAASHVVVACGAPKQFTIVTSKITNHRSPQQIR